jgi:hypothetical protein
MFTKTLILILILIGILAGLITIYILPSKYEILLWIALIILSGVITQKNCITRPFRNGFLLAVIIGIAITFTHIFLVNDYLSSHPDEIQQIDELKIGASYRLTLLAIAPGYWIILGLLTGLWTLSLAKLKTT